MTASDNWIRCKVCLIPLFQRTPGLDVTCGSQAWCVACLQLQQPYGYVDLGARVGEEE